MHLSAHPGVAVAAPAIEKRILVVRERQVMLDEDLADLYGVETKRLIEQVKRNIERFPEDFMFQLNKSEAAALRSQIATSNIGRGGRRYAPYVFTEQGVAMLSGVLRSERAIVVNIEIMRAFVELRRAASSSAAIEKRLEELERETGARLGQHDEQLSQIFQALRQLISPPPATQAQGRVRTTRGRGLVEHLRRTAPLPLLRLHQVLGLFGPKRDARLPQPPPRGLSRGNFCSSGTFSAPQTTRFLLACDHLGGDARQMVG